MNREGTLHIVQLAPGKYRVSFADYASAGGAMKGKEFVSEQALRNFFASIGVQPNIAQSAVIGLQTEGSASVLSMVLPEEMLVSLGLADRIPQQILSVRFTVFREPGGPVLAYSLAGPFISPSFSSKTGVRFADMETLTAVLNSVGLPGREVVSQIGRTYSVTTGQLATLGFKAPGW